MNDTAYSSYSTWEVITGPACGSGAAPEGDDAGTLAEQLQEVLGQSCDVDADFFEDAWRCGVAASARAYRQRQNRARPTPDCTFASLRSVGGWTWVGVTWRAAQAAECLVPMSAGEGYSDCRKAAEMDAKHGEGFRGEAAVSDGITEDDARRLLESTDQPAGMALKSAYRRLAKQWHPDRFERADERERTAATERMVAINRAYRMVQTSQRNA